MVVVDWGMISVMMIVMDMVLLVQLSLSKELSEETKKVVVDNVYWTLRIIVDMSNSYDENDCSCNDDHL